MHFHQRGFALSLVLKVRFSESGNGIVSVRMRTLGARDYGRRCVGLRPTPKIPAAREKNLWYPGYNMRDLGLQPVALPV